MKILLYLFAGLVLAAVVVVLLIFTIAVLEPRDTVGLIVSGALGCLFGLVIVLGWFGLLWRYQSTQK